MEYYITEDSFGEYCPANWQEIADYMNDIIDERGIAEDFDAVCVLWEAYCSGDIPGVPAAEWERAY
jgi:hypothetical protein